MASAKKCDNCGAYYDYPYKTGESIRNVVDEHGVTIDLCPICLKAVNETLEKKRNEILTSPVIDRDNAFVFTKDYIKERANDVICRDCIYFHRPNDLEPCNICYTKIFFRKKEEERPYGDCGQV